MSQSEQVRLNIQGGIATLSIHRPEAKNALSREIVDRIDVLLDQAAADPRSEEHTSELQSPWN